MQPLRMQDRLIRNKIHGVRAEALVGGEQVQRGHSKPADWRESRFWELPRLSTSNWNPKD